MSSSKKHHKGGAPRQQRGPRRANDTTVYVIIAMIGGFAALLSVPVFMSAQYCLLMLVGYAAIIAWITHLAAMKLYRGAEVPGWQQSLARIPLRFAGFGVKKGKPVEAAHDQPAAMKAILVSGIITLIVLIVAAYFVVRPVLEVT